MQQRDPGYVRRGHLARDARGRRPLRRAGARRTARWKTGSLRAPDRSGQRVGHGPSDSSRASSSRSSPPRRSAAAPASACRWCTQSSPTRAAPSTCGAPSSKASTFTILPGARARTRSPSPARRRRRRLAATASAYCWSRTRCQFARHDRRGAPRGSATNRCHSPTATPHSPHSRRRPAPSTSSSPMMSCPVLPGRGSHSAYITTAASTCRSCW